MNASSDVFNHMSDNILCEVCSQWYLKVVDDILIFGDTKDEAYKRLETILQIFQKHGLIVSCEKIQVGTKISWTGYNITIPEGGGHCPSHQVRKKYKGSKNTPLPPQGHNLGGS